MLPMTSAPSLLTNRRTASSALSASQLWNDTEPASLAIGFPSTSTRCRCSMVNRIMIRTEAHAIQVHCGLFYTVSKGRAMRDERVLNEVSVIGRITDLREVERKEP